MDFQTIKAQIEQSRRFEKELDGATYVLRVPSEHAWRVAIEENRGARGRVITPRAMRALLDISVNGWRGVTARHFLPDAPEASAVEFSPEACAELLDCRQDIADQLAAALTDKREEQNKKREAARKN